MSLKPPLVEMAHILIRSIRHQSALLSILLILSDLQITQLRIRRTCLVLGSIPPRLTLNQMAITSILSLSLQCAEHSTTMTETLLILLRVRKVSLKDSFVALPGPGTYRLPSDFGYYETKNKTNSKLMS
jgi:hypothetical protein